MAEAIDVFQEAIISFYENVRDNKFSGDSAISTYLFSIARFKWLNQLKKDKTRKAHHSKIVSEEILEQDVSEIIINKEKQGQVLDVFNLLGEACKKLLIQSIYYGTSMKEIAEKEDYSSEQIVRNKKYKCLKKLKSIVIERPDIIKMLKGYGG